VIDFGISALLENPNKKLKSAIGTSYYMAPEAIIATYDHRVDIWSAGIILYFMLVGKHPYGGNKNRRVN
jgi:serine/threonine protein kinase